MISPYDEEIEKFFDRVSKSKETICRHILNTYGYPHGIEIFEQANKTTWVLGNDIIASIDIVYEDLEFKIISKLMN